ncbi:hypothetical protein pdam_00023953 [Pocillopora damicornis]|uniref:CCHC-type domain-containing protein n=1 Tax=Pocillopora damicornis TaxID=46731 RepID=A0A3M6U763_POCDA|nr:hypothetical protein pdam_00023953 [Pocillopora damicornis]
MVALEHLPAPKGNFTPGPECYQTCLDWVKECELLLNVPLASKSKAAKATYVLIWAGKGGRTHIKSLNLTMEEKGDRSVLLKCSWSGESRNPMQLHQTSAAWKLTLEEAIEIAQNQDATAHQVGYIRPEFKGELLEMEIHKLQGNRQSRDSRNRQQPQRPASNDQKQGRSKKETCFYCGAKPSHPKSECPAKRAKCLKCGKEGHYGSVCKSKSKDARVSELQVQSTTASECVDCVLNEYEPGYFNAPIHHLKRVTVESLNHPKSEPLIHPLWLCQESSSQIFQIDCEVDTGASCYILSLYKAKALFGNDLKLGKPTVNLKDYNDSPVENLDSCIVYLYHGNKIFRVLCEVPDSKGHMIPGRKQALIMEYVNFPEVQKPAVQAKTDGSIKTLVEEPAKTTNGSVIPIVQKCTDPVNQRVYVQVHKSVQECTYKFTQCNQWIPVTVTKTPVASQPRSYSVETTEGTQLVKNRSFIRPAQEISPIPAENMKRGDSSSS